MKSMDLGSILEAKLAELPEDERFFAVACSYHPPRGSYGRVLLSTSLKRETKNVLRQISVDTSNKIADRFGLSATVSLGMVIDWLVHQHVARTQAPKKRAKKSSKKGSHA